MANTILQMTIGPNVRLTAQIKATGCADALDVAASNQTDLRPNAKPSAGRKGSTDDQ